MIILSGSNSYVYAKINTSKPEFDDAIPVTAMSEPKLELASPAAVLMEGSTGKVLYEKTRTKGSNRPV